MSLLQPLALSLLSSRRRSPGKKPFDGKVSYAVAEISRWRAALEAAPA